MTGTEAKKAALAIKAPYFLLPAFSMGEDCNGSSRVLYGSPPFMAAIFLFRFVLKKARRA